MTQITDNGRDWYQDRARGDGKPIDEVAVGSGSGSEADDATALADEEYRGQIADGNIELEDTDDTGRLYATIEIAGGTEVSGGTDISEMGIFAGGVLVWVDNFDTVEIEPGVTEEFTMPFEIRR